LGVVAVGLGVSAGDVPGSVSVGDGTGVLVLLGEDPVLDPPLDPVKEPIVPASQPVVPEDHPKSRFVRSDT